MISRNNNFHLIRLIAALQVASVHILDSLVVGKSLILWLNPVPGVPIFFFVSGFLVYPSLVRSRSLGDFFRRRALRIYPALWFFFAVTVALALAFGVITFSDLATSDFIYWARCQLTFFQYENVGLFRYFGVGTPNGVVWTIAVELQFYILTPLIAWLTFRRRWAWPLLIVGFVASNLWIRSIPTDTPHILPIIASFLPWIYMFLFGAWLSSEEKFVGQLLKIPLVAYIILFFATQQISAYFGLVYDGNGINPAMYISLSLLVLKLAYTVPEFSESILGENDISYGIYLSHMLVANSFVQLGLVGHYRYVIGSLAITIAVALFSWIAIERPMLSLKGSPGPKTAHDARSMVPQLIPATPSRSRRSSC